MTYYVSTLPTPLGPFTLACDAAGALVAAAFGRAARLRPCVGPGRLQPDQVRTRVARQQVCEYFAGGRTDFTVPLAPAGTPFQQRVWRALQGIRFGSTCSYGALARALQTSPRAVGGANAANPICLVVPCHRVVGADGSLVGFAHGTTVKRALLAHEAAAGRRTPCRRGARGSPRPPAARGSRPPP